MAESIFISYRRQDSQYSALAIREAMRWAFGDDEVFIDRLSLRGGDIWPHRLRQAVRDARVVLAVIGPGWLRAQDDATGTRRLDDPKDWVRCELEEALRTKEKVVPVMLDGYEWPTGDLRLSEALTRLLDCQRRALSADQWEGGLHELVGDVSRRDVPLRPGSDGRNPDGSRVLTGPRPEPMQRAASVLSALQLEQALAELPDWRVEWNAHPWGTSGLAQELARRLVFSSFQDAVAFMASAAPTLDTAKPPHHPRWEQQWRTLTLWFTTWDVGCRVTRLDVRAAQDLERLLARHRSSKRSVEA